MLSQVGRSGKTNLMRQHLGGDLKEVREQATMKSEGRVLWAERMTSAKILRQDRACWLMEQKALVAGPVRERERGVRDKIRERAGARSPRTW